LDFALHVVIDLARNSRGELSRRCVVLWVNTIAPSCIHMHRPTTVTSINYRSGSCVTPRNNALWKTPVVQLLTDCPRYVEAGCHVVARQVCIQPRSSAVNTTLPACAAERRAAAPLLLGAGTRCCRSISPARGALSSKPAARRCCCRSREVPSAAGTIRYEMLF